MISEGHSSLSFKKKRMSTTTETVTFDQGLARPRTFRVNMLWRSSFTSSSQDSVRARVDSQ